MNEWVWLVMLFVCVAGLSFVALTWANLRRTQVDPRLKDDDGGRITISGTGSTPELRLEGTGSTPEIRLDKGSRPEFVLGKDSAPDLVLGEMTPALAKQIPISKEDLKKLQPELVAAGYYSRNAMTQYLAIRATLVILPLVLAGGLAIMVDRTWIPQVVFGGLVLAVLGFSLPRVYINTVARDRRRQLEVGLPVAVDLLTLGITSGQNILTAFQRVARELRFSHPVLAYELMLVYRQASLNTLPHALEVFADRVQLAEIRNLVMILTQSQRLGTDVASGLLEFASNFRTTLRQRADAQANRASFWMLFPTIFCLWVPAAAVVAGPILFNLKGRYNDVQQIKQKNASEPARTRSAPGSAPGTQPMN